MIKTNTDNLDRLPPTNDFRYHVVLNDNGVLGDSTQSQYVAMLREPSMAALVERAYNRTLKPPQRAQTIKVYIFE